MPAPHDMGVLTFRSRRPAAEADAFTAEALAHTDALYRTARRLTRNAVDAEDLVQDAFLKAFRARGRFARGTNLRAWLFTILMNTWRNRLRDAGRDPVAVDSDVVERAEARSPLATPEDVLLRESIGPALQSALESMPEAFREAVWLRDVDEFSYAEIARMLDIPVGTVMSRISRGRRLLHDRLAAGLEADATGTVVHG